MTEMTTGTNATGELIGAPRPVRPLEGEVVVMADDVGAFMNEAAPVGAENEASDSSDDEDTSVSLDVEAATVPVVEDVVYELAVAAASSGREFTGEVLAELLSQGGPIFDVRLSVAIEVLRLGQKLTGDRMLRVLESLGFAGEAMAGRLVREEMVKAGGVAVEVTTPMPAGVEP